MNKNKLIIAGLSSVFCLSLASCQTKPEHVEAEGYDVVMAYYRDYFGKVFNHSNITIEYSTRSNDIEYTERILGDTSYLFEHQRIWSDEKELYDKIGTETWSFVNENGEKVSAKEQTLLDGTKTRCYSTGDSDYQNSYRSFTKPLRVFEKLESCLKSTPSSVDGKTWFDETRFYWQNYNYSVYGASYDWVSCTAHYQDDNEEMYISLSANLDKDTALMQRGYILIDIPECLGIWGEKINTYYFEMTYDDVEKIDIPDISGWEDMTNK